MFLRRDWEEEISGSRESPFLECRHLLFEEEAGYPICPSCGGLIKENFPKKGADKARLNLMSGQDWQVMTEEEFAAAQEAQKEKNNPFASLQGLFDE